jgi:glycosyltransferase involved in cell wall biosynthesis
MPGFVDDVLGHMACLDVFVLSSYLEGLGTAILDAMALGLPVVATAVGGVPDAVTPGQTGLLVPPRNPQALAQALLTLESDPGLRGRLARTGREAVRSFDVRVTIERTLAAYREFA